VNTRALLTSASLLGLALASAHAAQAQTTAPAPKPAPTAAAPNSVGEIVVTAHLLATGAMSATKQNVSTLDTPFSVSAYTGDFMKTIHTTQVADLYRYMTGLQKAGATGYDLTLRGFSTTDSDRNTILTDGLPGLAVRFGSPPTVGTDHIEIVKGAASLLYGAVQPGGFVNMITKKPQASASTEISLRGTTGASDRDPRAIGGDVSFDSTGPIDKDGRFLYRIVAQVSTDNRFRDFSYERGQYFAPSLTWNVSPKTTVTLEGEYRAVASNYASLFLLAPRKATGGGVGELAPIRTNYMAPTDYLHESGLIETLFVTHSFDSGAKWSFELRNVDHHDSANAFDITRFDRKDPTFQTLDLRARGQRNHRSYIFGDTYLTLPFNTFGVEHRVIVGASLGREVDDFNRTQFCAINSPDAPKADPTCNPTAAQYTVSLINPNFSSVPPLSAFGPGVIGPSTRSRNYVTGIGSGAYVSDLMTLTPHWKLSAGVRYASEDQRNSADLNEVGPVPGDARLISSAVLPQVGLIYEPTQHLSFYASYSTSFSPVPPGTQAVNGSYSFLPTKGKGYEIGAKTNLADGRLTFTAALFEIDQTNIIVPSSSGACSSGSCSEQIGAARSRGLELELSARPLPGWSLVAGYANTFAIITANADTTSGPLIGGLLPNSPVNAFHLWSRYDIQSGPLQNLGVGIGYSYTSSRIPFTPTPQLPVPFIIPAYQVVDLGFYYPFGEHYYASLKVNNLFDTNYYSSGTVTQGKINIQPGTPRTVEATVSYRF
jgi:iron complex outermembrane receptor protein